MVFNSHPVRRVLRGRLSRSTASCRIARRTGSCSPRATLLRRVGLAVPEPADRSTVVDYAVAPVSRPAPRRARARRRVLWISIGFNLGMLGLLQVLQLLRREPRGAVRRARRGRRRCRSSHVVLPIGISFYTFMTMSYVIDVYRRDIPPTRNLSTSRCSSPSSRTWSPARSCGRRRCCRRSRAPRRITPRADVSTARWLIALGPVQEDRRRRQPRAARQRRVRAGGRADRASTC